MRRFLGAVLAGLGAVLIVLAIGVPFFVVPAAMKLPYDLQPCKTPGVDDPKGCLEPSFVVADGAKFLQIDSTGLHIVESATLKTTVEVVPQPKLTADEQAKGKIGGNEVIWDVASTTQRADTGAVISQSKSELALDRTTGAADPNWDGQWIDDSKNKDFSVKFSGQEYKFPFDTQKQDYTYFDDNLRTALPLKFTSVETINGLDTYHFTQDVPDTQLTLDSSTLELLRSTYTPKATTAKLMYHDHRELWVAPVAGQIVKVSDHPVQTLVGDDGTGQVLLDADFQYTSESVARAVDSAKSNQTQLSILRLYGPIGAGVIGLVLLLVGVLLLRAPRTTYGERDGFDETLPEPRHRLRGDEGVPAAADTGWEGQ
jgi:hypothetical protein